MSMPAPRAHCTPTAARKLTGMFTLYRFTGSSFTNMHITASASGPVPGAQLWLCLGTVPDLFMYMDYIPRVDLLCNIDYVDRYYTEVNAEFLDLQSDERFNPFISRDLYTRVAMTPTAVATPPALTKRSSRKSGE